MKLFQLFGILVLATIAPFFITGRFLIAAMVAAIITLSNQAHALEVMREAQMQADWWYDTFAPAGQTT